MVFDVLGRVVTHLADGYRAAGSHSLTWRGRDESGIDVGTGVYLVHLATPEGRFARRILLLQ